MIPLMFLKVPQSSLGMVRVPQEHPLPLDTPLKNPINIGEYLFGYLTCFVTVLEILLGCQISPSNSHHEEALIF